MNWANLPSHNHQCCLGCTFVTKPTPSWPATNGGAVCASPYMPPVRVVYKSAGLIGASCMLTSTSPHSRLAASGANTSSRASCGGPALLQLTCMHMCHYQTVMQFRPSAKCHDGRMLLLDSSDAMCQSSKGTAVLIKGMVSSKQCACDRKAASCTASRRALLRSMRQHLIGLCGW